jgi:hypothetical protein
MKNKKNSLSTSSTYSSDQTLFKLLGLEPFTNIPVDKEHFVGEVKCQNESVVKIWVIPMPALFWKVEIYVSESKKTFVITTGSGALIDFWETIKLFADNMLDMSCK